MRELRVLWPLLLLLPACSLSDCGQERSQPPMAKGTAPPRRLSKEVPPLPEEMVPEMLRRIPRGDVVDLEGVYQALVGPQRTLRAYAARYLGSHGDESSVPYLVDALSDQSGHVGARYPIAGMATTRYWVNESLKQLTQKDFGFLWDDPIEKRDQAVMRWHAWYQDTHKDR